MGRDGNYGGAASDFVRVPYAEAMLVGLPARSDPIKKIGAADAVLDAWRCVGPYLQKRPGCSVLVVGGWPSRIGIYAAGVAVAMGAARVDYVDTDDARLAQAQRFGATAPKQPADLDHQYGIVVDSAENADALRQAIRATEPEGVLTSCTVHRGRCDTASVAGNVLEGNHVSNGTAKRAFTDGADPRPLQRGFDPSILETVIAPFEQAPDAFLDDAISVAISRP